MKKSILNFKADDTFLKQHQILIFMLIIAILGFGTFYSKISAYASTTTENQNSASDSIKKTAKKNKTVKITISAAGDCTLGIDPSIHHTFDSYYKRYGSSYFLKKVRKIFSKDDITIVNFEGTLTNSSNRAQKTYAFKGPANYAKILTKGSVEVVNLANNHSMDYGKTAYDDTTKALKKNSIQYCNTGTIAYKKVNGVKIAFLGFSQINGATNEQVNSNIKKAKKKGAKIIIVSFHWGIEKEYYPNAVQKSMAHNAIKNGASLVLGHHPHVLQGIEKYKGRYIVYSLGNFCFGGNVNPSDKDTMIFQQTFYVKNGKLLKKNDIKVIPCSLSSSTSTNDYQPKILSGDSKKNLIKKLNRLSSGMHVKFNSDGKPQK